MSIIKEAVESLCSALFPSSCSSKKVSKEGGLEDDLLSEMFEVLVMNGVLVDSFDNKEYEFVPTIPELFLHKWIKKGGPKCLDDKPRQILNLILTLRAKSSSDKYKALHSSWEKVIRYIRQCN